MGPILGAEFLVTAGGLRACESADQVAARAGLWCLRPETLANAPVKFAGCLEKARLC
jgi:hypothetical protein